VSPLSKKSGNRGVRDLKGKRPTKKDQLKEEEQQTQQGEGGGEREDRRLYIQVVNPKATTGPGGDWKKGSVKRGVVELRRGESRKSMFWKDGTLIDKE